MHCVRVVYLCFFFRTFISINVHLNSSVLIRFLTNSGVSLSLVSSAIKIHAPGQIGHFD